MALEKELTTYRIKLREIKENDGKYVLVHGTDIVGIFDTYKDAVKEGYAKFKLEPFMVKQIQSVEQVQFISRLLDPCHT